MSERTQVIVCYDVENTRNRTKLANALLSLGLVRVQKSVFWGTLLPAEQRNAVALFKKFLNNETDNAFVVNADLLSSLKAKSFGKIDLTVFDLKSYDIV